MKEDLSDVTELIRSIQRAEGSPDCFRRENSDCDKVCCAWRPYCLEKPQDLAEGINKTQEDEYDSDCR